jgi:hypothetical protein
MQQPNTRDDSTDTDTKAKHRPTYLRRTTELTDRETDASAGWREEYAHQRVASGGCVEARQTADSSPGRPSSGAGEWAVAGTPRPPAHDATADVERPPRRGGEQ